MKIYFKLLFMLSIFFSNTQIQPMTQVTNEPSNFDDDYEMYNFLENKDFTKVNVNNIDTGSVYDAYSDLSYIPEITPNSDHIQTTLYDNKSETHHNDTMYDYDYFYENERSKEDPVQIIACENQKELTPVIMQTKIDRILSSVICNPDHGMQAGINFVISGENVNNQDNATKTSPLHFATQWNAYKLGTILIAIGANINSQDIYGNTPLHILALYSDVDGNNEFAKILLDAGANLFIKDNDGKTAAKIALELKNMNLYNLIQETNRLRLIS